MILKRLIFLMILSFGFSKALSFDFFSFSTGSDNVPKSWYSSFFNVFKRIPALFSSDVKTKIIHTLLTKEHKTGIISNEVNRLFFSLDSKTAKMVGPKIAEFRKHRNAQNKILKDIANYAGFEKRFKS
jgi:hypothetical protein